MMTTSETDILPDTKEATGCLSWSYFCKNNFVFHFMKTFFVVLGQLYTPCGSIGDTFPSTLYMAQKSYTHYNTLEL